ncbi:MAG: RNA-processing protein [Methanocellales archaeon]
MVRAVKTWFGAFLVNDSGDIVECKLMPKDPAIIAERLFQNSYPEYAQYEELPAKEFSHRDLAFKSGFAESELEYNSLLHKVCIELARKKIKVVLNQRDQKVKQAIAALDEVEKLSSVLGERLKSWYSLYYAECPFKGEQLASFIVKARSRDSIAKALEKTSSASFTERDLEIIERLAMDLLELYRMKRALVRYIEDTMQEIAPNISAIAGGVLGAKLIQLAGGLRQLAEMPSSTIQILGASYALFGHLRDGKRPPKHGVIYRLPVIQKAPAKIRGKIARAVAAKLAIAARRDFYSSELLEALAIELDEKIAEINARHAG